MNQIFTNASRYVQLMCNTVGYPYLFTSRTESQYISFELKHSHGINADFFIRAQSVGFVCKGEDTRLFYLLQYLIQSGQIQLEVLQNKVRKKFDPHFAGDGKFSMLNPCSVYLAGISTGNLKGWSDIVVSRNESTFEARADFLANLLFTQFMVKMMPAIEQYKIFRAAGILAPYFEKVPAEFAEVAQSL